MKYYFAKKGDNEMCYLLDHFIDTMKMDGILEMDVYEAKMEVGQGYFYCREFGQVGQVGEGCGKMCKSYKPRNGKNGRCVNSSNCYIPTGKVKHIIIKP